jgi:tRNA (cytidine/uridine-2'-O-)-methyltransferase
MIQKPCNSPSTGLERHVVLLAPAIHWNTGNIGRTCLAAGAELHLIRPLGFSLANREVRRAGLDYWQEVQLSVHENFEAFLRSTHPRRGEMALLSKKGAQSFREMPPRRRCFLVFGSETGGIPRELLDRFPDAVYHIPVTRRVRSLNLSTAVGIALYESLRGTGLPVHAW